MGVGVGVINVKSTVKFTDICTKTDAFLPLLEQVSDLCMWI